MKFLKKTGKFPKRKIIYGKNDKSKNFEQKKILNILN